MFRASRKARPIAGSWLVLLMLSVTSVASSGDAALLLEAAKRQDTMTVRALLKQNVDVNTRQADGATALHWATHWNDMEMARALIGADADVNAANDFGVTPLSLACSNRSAALVEMLLQAGADPNSSHLTGETVLMKCAWAGNATSVRALLDAGAVVNARESTYGQTALMWAVYQHHPEVVRLLVERGADVNAHSATGFTPLLFAARVGAVEAAKILLSAGARVNEPDTGTKATPVLVATVRGHATLTQLLLQHGADANADGAGYTALHWAAGSWETGLTGINGIKRPQPSHEWNTFAGLQRPAKLEVVRALLAHGASPNSRMRTPPTRIGISRAIGEEGVSLKGATPFFVAAMAADVEVMQVLAANGADPNLTNEDGTTPLMVASGLGRVIGESFVTDADSVRALRLLLELGSDVNAVNKAGNTALHGAAQVRSNGTVQVLVEHGAELNVKNKNRQTPLMIAERTSVSNSAEAQFFDDKAGKGIAIAQLLRKLGAQ
jgi:ankyrin repeat protein